MDLSNREAERRILQNACVLLMMRQRMRVRRCFQCAITPPVSWGAQPEASATRGLGSCPCANLAELLRAGHRLGGFPCLINRVRFVCHFCYLFSLLACWPLRPFRAEECLPAQYATPSKSHDLDFEFADLAGTAQAESLDDFADAIGQHHEGRPVRRVLHRRSVVFSTRELPSSLRKTVCWRWCGVKVESTWSNRAQILGRRYP